MKLSPSPSRGPFFARVFCLCCVLVFSTGFLRADLPEPQRLASVERVKTSRFFNELQPGRPEAAH